jgi:Flp pilus assembly protein TadD
VSAKRLRHQAPKAARAAYNKAGSLIRKKKFEQAVKEFQRAIALDADFAEAHDDLGVAYTRLNRYREAEAEFRRTIELIPDESQPHSNLGWVLLATGRRAEAEASGRRAIHLAPDNAAAHRLVDRFLSESKK